VSRRPLSDCRLYTFVDGAYLHGRDPVEIARQLCDGGSDIVQLRAKDWSEKEIRKTAAEILRVTETAGAWLVINDYPKIASEVGAPLCHLGQEDFFDAGHTHTREVKTPRPKSLDEVDAGVLQTYEELRIPREDQLSLAGVSELGIGLSTHAPEQAERAIAAGPAYIAIGPVYPTGTKPTAKPVTLEYVRWAAANVKIPWFAIGGVNLQTIGEVLAAGATRVCVVSAILNAEDVAGACREFRRRMQN
jgi:thiamine-phosphate pyrophosphorylase